MDPVTAAGIGLSVTSLAVQVFSRCIKGRYSGTFHDCDLTELGYQLFLDCKDMPSRYEHLRVRLKIEQARCLRWGEKIGLVEELLDEPSRLLQLHNNLILNILQQIQSAFRSSLAITTKYDPYVRYDTKVSSITEHKINTSRSTTFLQKTLAVWEKGGRMVGKIEWAMLRKDGFEKLIVQLIGYNDSIESLLDRHTMEELRNLHDESNLAFLQMSDQISKLQNLVEALQVKVPPSIEGHQFNVDNETDVESLVTLAAFTARLLQLEATEEYTGALRITYKELQVESFNEKANRQFAWLRGRRVWLEWRDTYDDLKLPPRFFDAIEYRVQKLATILSSEDRPSRFRSPKCLGYTQSNSKKAPRWALIYEIPRWSGSSEFISLRQLIERRASTSLNVRIELATKLAESLLYLHAVNWIHKGICSENILFCGNTDRPVMLNQPTLSGFETSRPALPEEITIPYLSTVQRDLYRHPDLLKLDPQRSKKSHDIYSLGLVLAEIALWKPIEDIVQLKEVRRSRLGQVLPNLTNPEYRIFAAIDDRVGRQFSAVVQTCVKGGSRLGLPEGLDEEDLMVGMEITRAFHQDVVLKLKSIKV